MATHSGILAWEVPWTEGAWPAPVHGLANSWTQLGNETIETEELLVSTVKSNQSVCAKTTLYNFVLMHLYKIIRVPCS